MRVVVTGGAGFIGSNLVGQLAERGDDVVALVRDPARAKHLERPRVKLVRNDLSGRASIATHLRGADALVHAAGSYRIGIRRTEHGQMFDANLGTAERVLDAAADAEVPRMVYVSTVGVFGNTHGRVVDETFQRDLSDGFLSVYDETKFRAHEAAAQRQAGGAPIVIVQPSQVYGPDDYSPATGQLARAHLGKLHYIAFGSAGVCWIHVHDLAAGILAALDRGRIGHSYILAGECLRNSDAVAVAARVGGRRPPRLALPTGLLRVMAAVNDRAGGLPGLPGSLSETIRAGDNVTYWATAEKARNELGFRARSLEQGVADTWGRA